VTKVESDSPHSSVDVARRLLDKVRAFVTEDLDEEEGALFAALIAPGVSLAYPEDEVYGFGSVWRPDGLPETLAKAVVEAGIRVEGLKD
jgi:hypothetical protein